jgi:hypothetical protein
MFVEDSVRSAIEDVSRQVALAEATGTEPIKGLAVAWRKLTALMDLGPPPDYRTCPHCGATGMLMATRCGTCWEALTPPRQPASGP